MKLRAATLGVLRASRELLAAPESWSGGRGDAVDAAGRPVWHERDAVAWSLRGALVRCAYTTGGFEPGLAWLVHHEALRALRAVLPSNGSTRRGPVVAWAECHPQTTHADVLRWLDEAIAHVESSS